MLTSVTVVKERSDKGVRAGVMVAELLLFYL